MFPTIYGIALKGVGEDAKLGAAGLIMAILGGSVMPPLQGAIIDLQMVGFGAVSFPAVRASFILPLICFVVIAMYGGRCRSRTPEETQ
jgi:FHS family L-fucose permease-like MFS transporter